MIITNNEELLRRPCEKVKPEEVGDLIQTLENELNYANKLGKQGIGLAAIQVGILKDISIIRMENANLNLVNISLANGYDPAMFQDEGCLSFPGRLENTLRFQEVYMTNNLVFPHSFTATGLLAVVCQHEIDHLHSTLFTDRLFPKQTPIIKAAKQRPNDPCLCGSKKKYKKCCLLKGSK